MIENLTVENYRSFQNYSMNNLKRVNLLTGLNNSGKTSLLEAVELLASGGESQAFIDISVRRREAIWDAFNDSPVIGVSTHFFLNRDVSKSIRFQTDNWKITVDFKGGQLSGSLDDPFLRVQRFTAGVGTIQTKIGVDFEGGIKPPFSRARRPGLCRAEYIGIHDESFDEKVAEQWDAILVANEERNVIDALQILDDRIESVAHLSSSLNRGRMYVGVKGSEQRVPVGSFGEGLHRLLSLATLLCSTRGGILLVDEIDTGLHYSVLADMWKLVIGTAIKNDTQVFATTHSLDCLRGLNEACERNPEYAAEISLQTIDRSLNSSIAGDADDLKSAMNLGVEVR